MSIPGSDGNMSDKLSVLCIILLVVASLSVIMTAMGDVEGEVPPGFTGAKTATLGKNEGEIEEDETSDLYTIMFNGGLIVSIDFQSSAEGGV